MSTGDTAEKACEEIKYSCEKSAVGKDVDCSKLEISDVNKKTHYYTTNDTDKAFKEGKYSCLGPQAGVDVDCTKLDISTENAKTHYCTDDTSSGATKACTEKNIHV